MPPVRTPPTPIGSCTVLQTLATSVPLELTLLEEGLLFERNSRRVFWGTRQEPLDRRSRTGRLTPRAQRSPKLLSKPMCPLHRLSTKGKGEGKEPSVKPGPAGPVDVTSDKGSGS